MASCPCAIACRPEACSARTLTKSASAVNSAANAAASAVFQAASRRATSASTAMRSSASSPTCRLLRAVAHRVWRQHIPLRPRAGSLTQLVGRQRDAETEAEAEVLRPVGVAQRAARAGSVEVEAAATDDL